MGEIRFAKNFDDMLANGRLRFYGFIPDGGLIELEAPEDKHAQAEAWGSFSGGTGLPRAILPKEFWGSERTELKLEDLSSLVLKSPLLCFWISTVIIELQAIERKNCFKTRIGKTVNLGFRVFVPSGEVKKLELVMLGDQSYIRFDGTPAVAVVAIRWECGIAYREPLGLETVAYRD